MQCPDCSSENVPVRETTSGFGGSVRHPRHCGECGAALTESCAVCYHHHPIGTKFCQANGTNIERYRQERDGWKKLKESVQATLSVRPYTVRLALLASVFLGAAFTVLIEYLSRSAGEATVHMGWLLLLGLAISALFAALTGLSMSFIKDGRISQLLKEQNYQSYRPRPTLY